MLLPKTTCIWALICLSGLASGKVEFGDDNQIIKKQLDDDTIAKYYTESLVVGRDMEQGQCSDQVLAVRKRARERVLELIKNQHDTYLF
jgi:hypothetical protein